MHSTHSMTRDINHLGPDNQQHKTPHIHVQYQGDEVVFEIPTGSVLAGNLPKGKMKLVEAWIEIHQEDLIADWELAINVESVFKIDLLK